MIRSRSTNFMASNNIIPGNRNNLIYRVDPEENLKNKKVTNPKVYQSFAFNQEALPINERRSLKYFL